MSFRCQMQLDHKATITVEICGKLIVSSFIQTYPTTTTSSKACESSFSRTVKEVFPFTGIA